MDTTRYSLEALLEALGPVALSEVARSLGVSTRWVYNRRRRGFTWIEADEVAVHFGHLPWQVWPEWLAWSLAEAETDNCGALAA